MPLTKKQQERQSLDAVLRHVAVSPSGVDETEEPDFLLDIDSTIIGAEVTELYLPSDPEAALPQQAKENEERLMVDMARRQAIQRGVPAQQLQTRLSPHVLSKKNRTRVATELCNFVAANYAAAGEVKSFGRPQLPADIVHVQLYGLRETPHTWNGPCAGWVIHDFADGFQEAIDKKELLLPKYATRCVQCWLITVATHSGGSSFIEWSSQLAAHRFTSMFDRVFFVQGPSNTVNELQLGGVRTHRTAGQQNGVLELCSDR